jgi:dihydrofolate reductase
MHKGKVIVCQLVTLDGVLEDPDGSEGSPGGGWALRFGPERFGEFIAVIVAGHDFKHGSILDTGVLLMGRTTWDAFSRRWPNRSGDFADAMNRIPKVVVSRTAPALNAWSNSSLLEGELQAGVTDLTREQDVVVLGSATVVHALAAADAVDEYRLLVIPTRSERVSDCSSRPSTYNSRQSRPWARHSWRATSAPVARDARRWPGPTS